MSGPKPQADRRRPTATLLPRRSARALAAFALVSFVLSACSGRAGPPTSEPSTPSPAPSASTPAPRPSPSPSPTRPATANRDDVEGAIAAAQYFLELYPYAYNTGDLDAWKAMSHPECIFCASVVENVEALHADGGYEVGGEFVFEAVAAREPLPGNAYFAVDFTLTQRSGSQFGADHLERSSFLGGRSVAEFAVGRESDYWLVREVTVEVAP